MIRKYDNFNEAKKTEKSEKTIKAELVKYLKQEFPNDTDKIDVFFATFEKTTKKAVRTDSYTNITKDSIKDHFERYLEKSKKTEKKVKKIDEMKLNEFCLYDTCISCGGDLRRRGNFMECQDCGLLNPMNEGKLNENGNNDTPVEIMANMKTIANWTQYQNADIKNPTREMNILQVGKFIDTGKVRGYINRIVGNTAYVSDIDANTYDDKHTVAVPLKDIIKAYKTKKEKVVKADISITGPSNATVAKAPEANSGDVGTKLTDKSAKAKDQKISNKIYTMDTFKKLDNSELTPDFDSGKMIKKAPKYTAEPAKDQLITNKIYKVGDLKLTDLSQEPSAGKSLKSKSSAIGTELDGIAKQKMNADITKKNYKTKMIKENDATVTQDINGMGDVVAPIISEIPGQVNVLPSQMNELMSFEDFLNEDGVAGVTMGNSNGMGNISAPVIGANNTGQVNTYSGNGSPIGTGQKGSGDKANIGAVSMNQYQASIPKKKKKNKLAPKTVKFEHVIRFNDF